MKKLCLFFIALLVIQTNADADEKSGIIHGYVTDRTSGRPLIGANVYLANTTIGSSTNRNGYFIIDNIPFGVYDLIVSYIGYDQKFIRLTINDKKTVHKVDTKLIQQNFSLGEVVVTDSISRDYIDMFNRFKKEFFGTTQNAEGIRLYNPEVLELDQNTDGVLTATTNSELNIANNRLGYDLKLYIKQFSLDGSILKFEFKPFYIDQIDNLPDPVMVNALRSEAYSGSRRHFLKSLAVNQLLEDGFKIYLVSDLDESKDRFYSEEIKDVSAILTPESDYERNLNFDDYLKIVFHNELESDEFIQHRSEHLQSFDILTDAARQQFMQKGYQVSWIKLNQTNVKIDTSGTVYDFNGMMFYGYMAYERMADLLPVDYEYSHVTPEYISETEKRDSFVITQMDNIRRLSKLAAVESTDWQLHNEIGSLYLSLDQFESAREWFSKSLNINPVQEEAHVGMGRAYLYQGNDYNNPLTGVIEKISDSDNISRSEKAFKTALEINPNSVEGLLALSDRQIHSGSKSLLKEARIDLNSLSNLSLASIQYRLGQIAYQLDELETAESHFRNVIRADSLNGNAKIYLSRISALKEQYEEASLFYLDGLQSIDDRYLIDEIARYSEPILPPGYFDPIKGSRNEMMQSLAKFWLKNSTIGVANINEFLITYLKRVEFVRQHFAIKSVRLYDARGEIYLKFGPPNTRFTDPMPPKGIANESWVYENLNGREVSFDYVSYSGFYKIVPDLSYALPRGDRGMFNTKNVDFFIKQNPPPGGRRKRIQETA